MNTISFFKSRLSILFFAFIFVFIFSHNSYSDECIYARDTGTLFDVIVPARPDLAISNGYTNDTTSQRAAWTDSKLYTNGDPFYFEIEGMWTPWSATYDLIGGDNQENRNKYAGLQQKQADAFFCNISTKNENAERFDRNGEFDYISSVMNVEEAPNYTKRYLANQDQKTCWLTAGEGLYIGFFGRSGNELPSLATHLKVANILCDEQYLIDLNNDGIKSVNECLYNNKCLKEGVSCTDNEKVNKTNMAYYTPNSVRCESDFYHKNPYLPKNLIGINDCYQDVEYPNGIFREDKTIFIFSAGYLYKNSLKETIKKNERIKFVIYDRYYGDNVGQYKINIYSGAQDNSDKGLIEKIVRDLENLFVGSRNEQNIFEGGMVLILYNYLISDTGFGFLVRLLIIFYIIFLGFSFAIGQTEYKTKELMTILLKLTFVLVFTIPTSWKVYDYFIIRFFYDGFMSIVSMIGNLSAKLLQSENTVSSINSSSMASAFYFIDNIILSLFSKTTTIKILGLFFGVWYGFIVIPIIYILILYYIYQLINAIYPYIVMFIQGVFALFFGPIFIPLILFKKTQPLFKGWLNFIGGRFANMIFLFAVVYLFWMIIKQQFESLLFFNSCKVPLWQAITSSSSKTVNAVANFFSLGINVWDANWENLTPPRDIPNFFDMCLSLIFLFLMIYLFGVVIKKVPTIIDSMFVIDESKKGGGLNFLGQSRFGNIGGLFDNLNKYIQLGTGKFQRGKEKRVGITEFIKTKVANSAVSVRQKIFDNNFSKLKNLRKNRSFLTNKKILDAIPSLLYKLQNGTINRKKALDTLNKIYQDELKNKGFSDKEINKYMAKFSEYMERKLEEESVSMLPKDAKEYFLERNLEKKNINIYNSITNKYDRVLTDYDDKTTQEYKMQQVYSILNNSDFSSGQLYKLKNKFENSSFSSKEISKLNEKNIALLREKIITKNNRKIEDLNKIFDDYNNNRISTIYNCLINPFEKDAEHKMHRIKVEKNALIAENLKLKLNGVKDILSEKQNNLNYFLEKNQEKLEVIKDSNKIKKLKEERDNLNNIREIEKDIESRKKDIESVKEEKNISNEDAEKMIKTLEEEITDLENKKNQNIKDIKNINIESNEEIKEKIKNIDQEIRDIEDKINSSTEKLNIENIEKLEENIEKEYNELKTSFAGIELPAGGNIAMKDGGLELLNSEVHVLEDGGIELPGTLNDLQEPDKKEIKDNYKEIQEKIQKINEKMQKFEESLKSE